MAHAITLRLITRQAGGGEIVRTRRLDSGEALIGRAAECDIALPDLAVDMQHALMRVTGAGKVNIRSLTGQPFKVNGQASTEANLDAASGPVVSLGDYDLILESSTPAPTPAAPGPSEGAEEDGEAGAGAPAEVDRAGDVVVTVKVREAEKALSPSVFSLKASMFGRRRMAWTLGLAILALCLILPFAGRAVQDHTHIHPDRQWSTGPLSKAHAFLEKDCKACHQQAFVAVRDSACLSCHKATGDTAAVDDRVSRLGSPFLPLQMADHAPHDRLTKALPPRPRFSDEAQELVAAAFNHPTDRCASCHREHTTAPPDPTIKPTADIVRPGKPALIVVRDCAACHSRLKMRLPSTTLIDTPDWNRHPDFRPETVLGFDGVQPRLQRVALTAHPQEANGLTFSHRIHMDATGGVARQGQVLGVGRGYGSALTCASCHKADGTGGFQPIEMERDCSACHSLAFAQTGSGFATLRHHDMRNITGVLRGSLSAQEASRVDPAVLRRAMAPGGLCFDCHTIKPSAGPLGKEIMPVKLVDRVLPRGDFNHAVPAHAGVGAGAATCADCHKAQQSGSSSDFLMSGIATCKACHGKTEHQTVAAASAQCTTCHSYHAPGEAPRTGQDRLFGAMGLAPGVKPRGLPTL